MNKKSWLMLIWIAVISSIIVDVVVSQIFVAVTQTKFPWWAYVILTVIVCLTAYLIFLLAASKRKRKFDDSLAQHNFSATARYVWSQYELAIDFDSKQIVNTYLTTRKFVRFSDVAGYRFETYRNGAEVQLPPDRLFVSIVISVKKQNDPYNYAYIPVFEVEVASGDVSDDVGADLQTLSDKYPDLLPMVQLRADLDKILADNQASGIRSNVINNN